MSNDNKKYETAYQASYVRQIRGGYQPIGNGGPPSILPSTGSSVIKPNTNVSKTNRKKK